jgi:hypothetical protein
LKRLSVEAIFLRRGVSEILIFLELRQRHQCEKMLPTECQ